MLLTVPDYPPALAFHRPRPAPFVFGVDTMAISELLANPTMREVLAQHAPAVLIIAKYDRPYLSDSTLKDVAMFFLPGAGTAMSAAVDAALRKIPRSEWPADAQ